MYSRINENFISEIRDRADIVEIISEYVRLTKAGINFKGLCPFHNEKTPSFVVSQTKQIFHCFGCGEGGNIFTFIMKLERVSFVESVKIIADKLGINIELEKTSADKDIIDKKKSLFKINQIAAIFFNLSLLSTNDGKNAREYLIKRNITKDTTNKFLLGYMPYGLDKLMLRLKNEKIPEQLIFELGLINKNAENESLYCRFRDRIMFPIFDFNGKIAGFGGRIINSSEKKVAKYINSPDSIIYNKSNILFGLNFAKTSLRANNYLILVEGYMDAITLHQAGIENVVATMGTSLTEAQAKLIRRLTDKVIIVYDADNAGIKAADRGIDILLENDLYVRIGILPSGMDPDSFICQNGKENFLSIVNKSLDIFTFKLHLADKAYDKKTIEGKIKITNELLPLIIKSKNTIQKQEYIKQLSEYLDVKEDTITAELEKKVKKEIKIQTNENKNELTKTEIALSEKMLLQFILKSPDLIKEIFSKLSLQDISNVDIQKIFAFLKTNQSASAEDIILNFQDEYISKLLSGIMLEDFYDDTLEDKDKTKMVYDCMKKIKDTKNKQKIKELYTELKRAQIEEQKAQIMKQINDLKQLQFTN